MSGGKIYVWNPRTQQSIGSVYDLTSTNSGGRINIGDFDNDGMVEIGTAGANRYVVLEYNAGANALQVKWQKTGLDDGSQRTGSTLFDFEGDGINEVVYSEEANLYVWSGLDGTELVRIPNEAGTRMEYPIVADVNNDGAAEIIITAQNGNGPKFSGNGYIRVYRALNTPWVSARPVWNQHGFNNVNINDDLTIPKVQQNPLLPIFDGSLNSFLSQSTIILTDGTPAFLSADATAEVLSVDITNCPNSVEVEVKVENLGDEDLPAGTPIAVYDRDPTAFAANLLGVGTVGSTVLPQEMTTTSFPVTITGATYPLALYVVVNDPGFAQADLPYDFSDPDDFPATGTAECDFTNNIDDYQGIVCLEICGDGFDNNGNGFTDEPNITAPQTEGCSGDVLTMMTTDVNSGDWSIISSIGSTIDNNGVVTLGTNHSPTPMEDLVIYDGLPCMDTISVFTFDDEIPTITCPGNIQLSADATCMATVPDFISTTDVMDNCSAMGALTVVQSPAAGQSIILGMNTVTLTVTDEAGNSNQCTVTIDVLDRTDPEVTCPATQTLLVDNNCQASVPNFSNILTLSDNCSTNNNITIVQNPMVGTILNGHNTTENIIITITDEAGNQDQCSFQVVLKDEIAPMLNCPADQVLATNGTCMATLPDYRGQASAMDNCAAQGDITLTQTPMPGTTLSGSNAMQVVTISADDGNGNMESCTFTITTEDNIPPQITCPADQMATVDDNCQIAIPDYRNLAILGNDCASTMEVTVVQTPAPGTIVSLPPAMIAIQLTGTDENNNSESCTFQLILEDRTPPEITCPSDLTLDVNGSCELILADYTTSARVDDNCTAENLITITQSPAANTVISGHGTIQSVMLTATDEAGNQQTCSFNIELNDNNAPQISCPADQTLNVDDNCEISLPDYSGLITGMDNCEDIADWQITQSPMAGTILDGTVGSYTIQMTVSDGNENESMCSFSVMLNDVTAPELTCIANQILEVDENCQTTIPDYTNSITVTDNCSDNAAIDVTQSPIAGTTLTNLNTPTTITIRAEDENGQVATCTFTVTPEDMVPPQINCPATQHEERNADCEFITLDYRSLASFSDNCSAENQITITQSPAPTTVIPAMTNTVEIILTAEDENGNVNECSFIVVLTDKTLPEITCPTTQNIAVNADCQVVLPDFTNQATVSDNCTEMGSIAVTQNPEAGTILSSNQTVTLFADDGNGNIASCTFEVEIMDETAPQVTCPDPITLNVDDNCEIPLPDFSNNLMVSDNCSAEQNVTISQTPAAGTMYSGDGTQIMVTLMATDEANNSNSCTFTVTLEDMINPSLTCPANQNLVVDDQCTARVPDFTTEVSVTNNCMMATGTTLTQLPTAGTIISGVGTTQTITITAEDINGNQQMCDFEVTLIDTEAPVLVCPADRTLAADGGCQIEIPDYTQQVTVSDNCTAANAITITQSPLPGTALQGHNNSTTIELTADDGNENMTTCSFMLTVKDEDPPFLACIDDQELTLDDNCQVSLPDYTFGATVTDNCVMANSVVVTQMPVAGTLLSGHQTVQTVTFTANDGNGNTATCTFQVTLLDEIVPEITCPGQQTIALDSNCEAMVPDFTSMGSPTDNCTMGTDFTITQSPVAGTLLNQANVTQPITLTVTDAAGNQNTCTFSLVVEDKMAADLTCPGDQVLLVDANCTVTLPDYRTDLIAMDNCNAATDFTITQLPAPGTTLNGSGTAEAITLTAEDGNGNTAQCTFTVRLEDKIAPMITCPVAQDVTLGADCQVALPNYITAAAVSDNCFGRNDIDVVQTPAAGTIVSGHATEITVVLKATDAVGNEAQCDFIVTLNDESLPQITCPQNQTLSVDDNCPVPLPDYRGAVQIMDNCTAMGDFTVVQMPVPGTNLSGDGTMETIFITVTDEAGNERMCDFLVTLEDNNTPSISCPSDQILPLDQNCAAILPDYTNDAVATSDCLIGQGLTVTQSPIAGTPLSGHNSQYQITLTVDDGNGNTNTCQFEVRTEDVTPADFTCPLDRNETLNASCEFTIPDYTSLITPTDNCAMMGDIEVTQTPLAGTVLDGHDQTETINLLVKDGNGNTNQCSFEITLKDEIDPVLTCPADRDEQLTTSCQFVVPDYTSLATATDNCTDDNDIQLTQIPTVGTIFTEVNSTETITITANDGNGNSTSCSFEITLKDEIAPVLDCPADFTLVVDNQCMVAIPDLTMEVTVTDNCQAEGMIQLTQLPVAGTMVSGNDPAPTVVITAQDGYGNSTTCDIPLIINDETLPVIDCPPSQDVIVDTDCKYTLPDFTQEDIFTDNCTADNALVLTQSPAAGTELQGHNLTQVVTLTATDAAGNEQQCMFTLTLKDTTAPTLTCPADLTDFRDATCNYVLPDFTNRATVTDNCAAFAEITLTQSPAATTEILPAQTEQIITLTANDGNGNETVCMFTLTIEDNRAPLLECPADLDLVLDANCQVATPDFTQTITVTDNCTTLADLDITQSPLAGTPLTGHEQAHTITVTATDESGNSSTCEVVVTTLDETAPMYVCLDNQELTLDGSCANTIPDFTTLISPTDNCTAIADLQITQTPAVGTAISGHNTTEAIKIVVADGNGNSTECDFTLTVVDETLPEFTCPTDQDIDLSEDCNYVLEDFTTALNPTDNCRADADIILTQTPNVGTILTGVDMVHTITITADDGNGNVATCDFDLTLRDTAMPDLVCPADQIIDVDDDCIIQLPDYIAATQIGDNCTAYADLIITQDPVAGAALVGDGTERTVTIRVEDESGNVATCSFIVTLQDNNEPVIVCPADKLIDLNGNCQIQLPDYTDELRISNDCMMGGAFTVTQSPMAGTLLAGHNFMQVVTLMAMDENGNTSSCTFNVTTVDNELPTIECPLDQTIDLTTDCQFTLPDYRPQVTAADNCDNLTLSQSPAAGMILADHATEQEITITADDGNGNQVQCSFTVMIQDVAAPILTCPADRTLEFSATCEITVPNLIAEATATDNCTVDNAIALTQTPAAGMILTNNQTSQTVTLTANDGNGNQSQCTVEITLVDVIAPTIACPGNQEIEVNSACEITLPDYTSSATVADNCTDPTAIMVTQMPPAGTVVPDDGSTTVVTLTATDASNNSMTCTFNVQGIDRIAPMVDCPADREVELDYECKITLEDYRNLLTISDNCYADVDIVVVQMPAAGTEIFNHNTRTEIIFTVTDGNNNQSQCSFFVTAIDRTEPTLTCPDDQVLIVDDNCEIVIPDYRTTLNTQDNCTERADLQITQTPAAGTTLTEHGTTRTVLLTVADGNGNESSCSFQLTLEDEMIPEIVCPDNQTVELDANCNTVLLDYRSQAMATDNCFSGSDIVLVQSPAAGMVINGHNTVTSVTITATDGNGNMNQCTFTVTTNDVTQPTINCPSDETVSVGENCEFVLPNYTTVASVMDNCTEATDIQITQMPAFGTTYNGHSTEVEVTLTADDGNGNTRSCSFTITLDDDTLPTIQCPDNQEISLDGNCQVEIPDYTAFAQIGDNCTLNNNLQVTQSPVAGTVMNMHDAEQIITLTVNDGNGNVNTCIFTVTAKDERAPILDCPATQTINVDDACPVPLPDYRSATMITDNCVDLADLTVTQSPLPGTILSGDGTTQTVTITAADGNGNSRSCEFFVVLKDIAEPSISCPADQTLPVGADCDAALPDYRDLVQVSNDCMLDDNTITLTQSPAPQTVVDLTTPIINVTITAEDVNGNTSTCMFSVNLVDEIAPTFTCPTDKVIAFDAGCQYIVADFSTEILASLTDNCSATNDITISQNPMAGTVFMDTERAETIELTVTDESGNSTTCTFLVNLQDQTPPTISCPANENLILDENCQITIPNYLNQVTVVDNCTAEATIDLVQTPPAGTVLMGHDQTQTIRIVATDGTGNSAECSFVVTLKDETLPTIECPINQTLIVDDNCEIRLPDFTDLATVADNCRPMADIEITQSPVPNTLLSGHATQRTITLTANDGNGNEQSCTFMVELVDEQAPEIECIADQVGVVDGNCGFLVPNYTQDLIVTDNCRADNGIILTQQPAVGTLLMGHNTTQQVVITANDLNGNTSQCIFTLTLADRELPEPTCPTDLTLDLDDNCELRVPDFTGLTVMDNCTERADLTIIQTPTAGTIISRAATVQNIQLTIDDNNGNIANCSFDLTLKDATPPVLQCIENQVVGLENNCDFVIPDYRPQISVTDNCEVLNDKLILTQTPEAGTIISEHNTVQNIEIIATDGNGNTSNCSFELRLDDVEKPSISCPPTQSAELTDNCTFTLLDYTTLATVSDNCTSDNLITVTQSPAIGMIFSGADEVIEITLTADDGNGNTEDCTFDLNLLDTTEPELACVADQSLRLDNACQIELPDYRSRITTDDNCTAFANLEIVQTPAAGTIIENDGTTVLVSIAVTDESGNLTTCNFSVTVEDETPATLVCPENQVISVDDDCEIQLPDYRSALSITDNCGMTTDFIIEQLPEAGKLLSGDGTVEEVTLVVDDGNGNFSQCTFTVTLEDSTDPTLVCVGNQEEILDANCSFVVPDYTMDAMANNQCESTNTVTITQDPIAGTVLTGVSMETITLTARDVNGNESVCSFQLNLVDEMAPLFDCPDDIILTVDNNCQQVVPNVLTNLNVTDNCTADAAIVMTQNPVAGTPLSNEGTVQNVVITLTDVEGNSSQCDLDIMLIDETPPTITCIDPQVIDVNIDCEFTLPDYTSSLVIGDNCTADNNLSITQLPVAGTVLRGHATEQILTFTVTDASGNSSECTSTIELRDNIAPELTCPTDRTINLDEDCEVLVPDYTQLATKSDNCADLASIVVTQDPAPNTIWSGANNVQTVTLTATDGNNSLTTTCTFEVTLLDEIVPEITCPADEILDVDAGCTVRLPDYTTALTLNDNCTANADLVITQSPLPETVLTGHNTEQIVTMTVLDASGNSTQCQFTVRLRDVILPTIECPENTTLQLDETCGVRLPDYTEDVVVADNCTANNTITITQSPSADTLLTDADKIVTVTVTADDGNGNIETCDFTIQLLDRIKPTVECIANQEVILDENCAATLADYRTQITVTDNCTAIADLLVVQTPAAGTPLANHGSVTPVQIAVTDASGNVSYCDFIVTTIDNSDPILTCPADKIETVNSDCVVVLPDYRSELTLVDNCAMTPMNVTQLPLPGTILSGHNTSEIITLTADDGNGNVVQCTFKVTLKDEIQPMITCPADETIALLNNCTAIIPDYTILAEANDNCTASQSIVITQTPTAGTIVADHNTVTTIRLTADDGNGNQQFCEFDLTVTDQTPPAITCPETQYINTDDGCNILLPDYRPAITATDNCNELADFIIMQVPVPNFVLVGDGTNQLVTITVDDGLGNRSECSFNVVLQDLDAPTISCPGNQILLLDAGCSVSLPDYTSQVGLSNGCNNLSDITVTQSPANFTFTQPNETQLITMTATDGSGNSAQCTFTVTAEDEIAPMLECPADVVVEVDDRCEYRLADFTNLATATDNCQMDAQIIITQQPTAGTLLAEHETTQVVTLTAADQFGNQTQCTFIVTLDDNTDPTIVCPAAQTLELNTDCQVVLPDYRGFAQVADNCEEVNALTVVQTPAAGTVLDNNAASITINISVADNHGNSTNCDFTVNIIDVIQPAITCPATQRLAVTADCEGIVPDYLDLITTTDNCTASDDIMLVQSPAPQAILMGLEVLHEITITATDAVGNARSCSFNVQLFDDIQPDFTCVEDQRIVLDDNCQYTIPDFTQDINPTDNCSPSAQITMEQSPAAGLIMDSHLQEQIVTLTATDESGNQRQCSFTVQVIDDTDPEIVCPEPQTLDINDNCAELLPDYRSLAMVSDNCASDELITVTQTPAPETSLSRHNTTQTIRLTAEDGNGNSTFCEFTVTLLDVTPPVINCPANQVAYFDENCNIATPDFRSLVESTFPCADEAITWTYTQITEEVLVDNSTERLEQVTILADDGNGNQTTCAFQLTIQDNRPPTILECPVDREMTIEPGQCNAVIPNLLPELNVVDNCTNTRNLQITQTPNAGMGFGIQTGDQQVIIFEIIDESGNRTSCSVTLTAVDREAPMAICQPLEIALDANGEAQILPQQIDNGSSDNCGILSTELSQTYFDCTNLGENIITFTVTDVAGNQTTCTTTVTVDGTNALPTVVASDTYATCGTEMVIDLSTLPIPPATERAGIFKWTTSGTGTFSDDTALQPIYFATPADTANQGVTLTIVVTGNAGTCADITTATTEVEILYDNRDGDFDGLCDSFDPCICINEIYLGDDPTISDPCSCLNNATNLENGQFGELITIESIAGMTWTIVAVDGLYRMDSPAPPAAPIPVETNFIITESTTTAGIYQLNARHIDAIGFTLTVQNEYGDQLSIDNRCYYPNPMITTELEDYYCLFTEPIVLSGSAEGVAGTGVFYINDVAATKLEPMELGLGEHVITYEFDAGEPTPLDPSDPGCITRVTTTVTIGTTPTELACNDGINISVSTCEPLVTPDMILEGEYGCFDDYEVVITAANGENVGNPIDTAYLGQQLIATVRHLNSDNSCWGYITFEDKVPPRFDCDMTFFSLACSGDTTTILPPVAYDACGDSVAVFLYNEYIVEEPNCEYYQIKRDYIAKDLRGNVSDICTQTIQLNQQKVFAFPEDVVIDCKIYAENPDTIAPTTLGAGQPNIPVGDYCNLRFYHNDDTIAVCNGFKIFRSWEVIDICRDRVLTIDSLGNDGYQTTEVVDNTPPVIERPVIQVNAAERSNNVHITCFATELPPAIVSDSCGVVDEVYIITPAGRIDGNGGMLPTGGLPFGTHTVTYYATDNCGNASSLEVVVEVIDNQPPTMVCENEVVTTFRDSTLTMEAEDFDAGSRDNCCLDRLLVAHMQRNSDDLEFAETITLDCDDYWNPELQVVLRAVDCSGNFSDCMVDLKLYSFYCNPPEDWILAGNIRTFTGTEIEDVEMSLNGTMHKEMLTDVRGDYAFNEVENGGDYTVVPHKDDHPTAGVTTFDLILIRKHIVGLQPLTNPYQLIAADANRSGTITTLDVVQLQKLVLGLDRNLANNTSWRFVDADYQFPEPTNPWATAFPEVISYNNLAADDMAADFIAIKIGDVNGSSIIGIADAGNQNGDLLASEVEIQDGFILHPNRPNPFSTETLISFELPKETVARLEIRSVTGQLIWSTEGIYPQGYTELLLTRQQLPQSGVLYYTLISEEFVATRTMIIAK
ncbi:MAG: HYR domain-containing protein [Saprospiraceae bacterium]